MSRTIDFFRVIRGVECQVFASDFDYDPSTGIEAGPGDVWAKTEDGADFELTEAERDAIAATATEIWLGDDE